VDGIHRQRNQDQASLRKLIEHSKLRTTSRRNHAMKTLIRLMGVACFAGAAFAQQPSQPPKPGPEHQKLGRPRSWT
jgi:hypothetical protein